VKEMATLNMSLSKITLVTCEGMITEGDNKEIFQKNVPEVGDGNVLIIDFRNVEYIDRTGLGVLFLKYRIASNAGGHIIVITANNRVRGILEIAGFAKIVRIVETLEAALEAAATLELPTHEPLLLSPAS
jgi:anti-sigma B factor antagonist